MNNRIRAELVLFIASLVFLALSIVAGAFLAVTGNDIIRCLFTSFCSISAVCLAGFLFILLRFHGINHGLKYFFRHFITVWKFETELKNVKAENDERVFKNIPTTKLSFDDELITGRLEVKATARFLQKLQTLNFSPNLGRYRVEEVKMSRDENWLYYDLVDAKVDYRLNFCTLNDFKRKCAECETYELFLDARTSFTLCHALIVGATGSGKTYLLYALILQMMLKELPFNLYIADAKGADIYQLGLNITPTTTARDEDEIIQLLEDFQNVMIDRQREMADKLKQGIDKTYMDFGMSPYVLIFDELAAFLTQIKTKDKATRDKVTSILSNVVLKGRSVGCFLIVAMQKSDASTIDTAIRDNLVLKVCLGNAEATTITTCFGAGADVPDLDLRVGEGFYTLQGKQNKPKIVMGSKIDFDILSSFQTCSPRGGSHGGCPKFRK